MRNTLIWLCFGVLAFGQKPRVDLQPNPQQDMRTQLEKNNQTLGNPKEAPLVTVGETAKLVFHVSPLSGTGLLSQQTRDAMKAILRLNGGAQIIHIRAFSAGNGDLRRIPQIVAEVLGDKHGPLPSVSVLQAGALTLGDAQVVLEAVSVGKKTVNQGGLMFHPAEEAIASDPAMPVRQVLRESMDQLAGKMGGKPALSVTCFVSTLDGADELWRMMAARFPGAAIDLVQPRRLPWQNSASCEGVSRDGGVTSARVAFSGTQVAFGAEEKDATLALQRLDRALGEYGATRGAAALLRLYVLSPGAATEARKLLGGSVPVATVVVEGVGPASAGYAIDAVAPAP